MRALTRPCPKERAATAAAAPTEFLQQSRSTLKKKERRHVRQPAVLRRKGNVYWLVKKQHGRKKQYTKRMAPHRTHYRLYATNYARTLRAIGLRFWFGVGWIPPVGRLQRKHQHRAQPKKDITKNAPQGRDTRSLASLNFQRINQTASTKGEARRYCC